MQELEWKLVPTEPTDEMLKAAVIDQHGTATYKCTSQNGLDALEWEQRGNYRAMLAAAPEPPHLSMTKEEAAVFQAWRGMDGACAFHLIERHANGWGDTARMMAAWLAANAAPSNAEISGRSSAGLPG